MAKGIGLIGNFRGKVGNMVGYNLKDSNNKQTQGVRVYQPVVKNPKTYAQAEQRAKLAPINATYRALKPIIDRGQESKAYGNKSRLAWLKQALSEFNGGWFAKGAVIVSPAACAITKGTLTNPINYEYDSDSQALAFTIPDAPAQIATIGAFSAALLAAFPSLKMGDQLTFILVKGGSKAINCAPDSIVLDSTSNTALPSVFTIEEGAVTYNGKGIGRAMACAIVLSREGSQGEHLRSSEKLAFAVGGVTPEWDTPEGKEAAIKSYMAAGTTSDWPEEQIQG